MVLLTLFVIAGSAALIARRVDVRLVLLGAGLVLATAAGQPLAVADAFARGMVGGPVAPICAAMGFAAVLGVTGCDRHLVRLLLAPVRRVPRLLVPGGILAAYFTNLAIPSQTSTAATLGPVIVPLLLAAGFDVETAGAALLLGASFGGDLLNPGAQDVQALAGTTALPAPALSARVIPASLAGALVAAVVFGVSARREPGYAGARVRGCAGEPALAGRGDSRILVDGEGRLDLGRAVIPLVPVALLLLAYGGAPALAWLVRTAPGEPMTGALPVVRAMLIGTLLAALVGHRQLGETARGLFEGMGAAYATIISLTIAAQCFGAGLAASGFSQALLATAGTNRAISQGLAVLFPWGLALLSGSGSGPVLVYGQTLLAHAAPGPDAVRMGALACLAGAFGRTLSPVAAVVIYCSGLVGVPPLRLIRRASSALLAGAVVALVVASLQG